MADLEIAIGANIVPGSGEARVTLRLGPTMAALQPDSAVRVAESLIEWATFARAAGREVARGLPLASLILSESEGCA